MVRSKRELELALAVVSRKPHGVLQRIGEMREIGPYRSVPGPPQRIHDRYLDTPDRQLRSRNLALRLREVDSSSWITLKGNLETTQTGSLRMEIDQPWCEWGLENIRRELEQRSIVPRLKATVFQNNKREVMEGLGFFPIQDRYTLRQTRHIHLPGQEGMLSELALDRVTYICPYRRVRHHEVEIEAKQDKKGTSLEAVGEALLAHFGKTLRKWPYNKLVTGLAVERMLREGDPGGLLDSDGCLVPRAYERVADFAEHEEASP